MKWTWRSFCFWVIAVHVVTLTVSVSELQKKLGGQHLEKAYNYLKRARFDDRRPGTDIDERTILHDLSKMVPDADDRFRVEQLLFLEMQINSWVSPTKEICRLNAVKILISRCMLNNCDCDFSSDTCGCYDWLHRHLDISGVELTRAIKSV